MNIFLITSEKYDYLAAEIIDGLMQLREERRIGFAARHRYNYLQKTDRASWWSWRKIARQADLIIEFSGKSANHRGAQKIGRFDKTIFIDGRDAVDIQYPPAYYPLVFKRELFHPLPGVLPCPFAIERRWLQPLNDDPPLFLSALFDLSRPNRKHYLELTNGLKEQLGEDRIFVGLTLPTQADIDHAVHLHLGPRPRPGRTLRMAHNARYYKLLHQSAISLSLAGAGFDTARFWEILGAGALLLSPKVPILMPNPLQADVHYVAFESEQELVERVLFLVGHPEIIQRVRLAAREHVLKYHTTRARAIYILENACRVLGLPPVIGSPPVMNPATPAIL